MHKDKRSFRRKIGPPPLPDPRLKGRERARGEPGVGRGLGKRKDESRRRRQNPISNAVENEGKEGRASEQASESREDDIEGNDLATMTFAIDSVRGKEGREFGDWLPTVININEQNPTGQTDKHKIREL